MLYIWLAHLVNRFFRNYVENYCVALNRGMTLNHVKTAALSDSRMSLAVIILHSKMHKVKALILIQGEL